MTETTEKSGRPLLDVLASLPPEALVEGARFDVVSADGREWSITFGPRVQAEESSEWTL